VDFSFDETQQAIAGLAATVLRADADHARTQHALASTAGYDETAWKSLAQAGLLALALPDSLGGDGAGAVELGIVLTAVGRQTLPLPALATLALGVLPVRAHGTAQQQEQLLAGVADGAVLTAALREAPGVTTTATGAAVSGTRIGVPYAAQARYLLVPTADGTAVVDPNGPGSTLTRTPTSSGAPEYTVRFDAAPVLERLDLSPGQFDRFAVAGAAALADGTIDGALALTAAHVRERRQFGKPLATFQAVAQQVADVYVTARTMHLAATSALWRLGTGRDADDDLAVAAYWLAAEVPPALQVCHHLHGGLGVDITYPLHRYYSQAKDLARLVGGAASRLDAMGDRCSSN
jgi:alkylation response protein AidB-like acyl-CoA dehydrogenase